MGVPAFFRWLSRKYPSIIVHCVEERAQNVSGHSIPVDASQPNPNEVEFDNLYLDMNGIIHPCCHPEDKPAPKDEEEMMAAIFEYIDRIFNIVRPRQLLYMAIDGVAPRAKMNQQRSRRFRSSKESIEKREEISQKREELESLGRQLPPPKSKDSHFDSNCITPGTHFMARLAVCLQYYIHDRLNNSPAWQGIKVILSDANVPGEGEHKIMDYIRRQRGHPDHNPDTHHCLYGADADLIMLGLATHEPHFTILREEFKPGQNQSRPCELCGQLGHTLKECTGEAREQSGEFDQFANTGAAMEKDFVFIRLCVLREYLERELRIDGLPFPFELERAIDDWVFMCFFVGNDFLPHLPSLEIREGAIDRLIRLYKQVVPQTHGYLTFNGRVNLARVQLILTELGKVEDEIFKSRRQKDLDFRRRNREKRRRTNSYAPRTTPGGQFAPRPVEDMSTPLVNPRHEAYQMRTMATSNQSAAASLKESLKGNRRSLPGSLEGAGAGKDGGQSSSAGGPVSIIGQKRKKTGDEGSDSEPEDSVRLWEDGWKERYYQDKFGVPSDDLEFRDSLTEQYTRGLCWVLGYYYQGCPSWKWFYPFHYAPFAADFRNIKDLRNDFDAGTKPFRPLEQLMGVFPEPSGKFLPPSWHNFMQDEASPIIDFYPTNFRIDLNGKKWAWQGVALLPFVDEDRLRKALSQVYSDLTPDEVERNSLGIDRIFVHSRHALYPSLKALYEQQDMEALDMDPQCSQGLRGVVSCDSRMSEVMNSGGVVRSPLPEFPTIQKTHAICTTYKDPVYPETYIFEAKLLPKVTMPGRVLKSANYHGNQWRPQTGFNAPPQRSYSTPESAQRTIRHSLSDPRHPPGGRGRGRGYSPYSPGGGGGGGGGEMYSSQGASHSFRGGGGKYGGAARSHSDGYVYEEGGYNSGGYNSGGYNSGGYNSGGYNSGGYGGDYRGSGYDNADSAHYGRDVSRSRSHGSYGAPSRANWRPPGSSPHHQQRQDYGPSHSQQSRQPDHRYIPPPPQQHGNNSRGYGNSRY